jgi:hypothetical protein
VAFAQIFQAGATWLKMPRDRERLLNAVKLGALHSLGISSIQDIQENAEGLQ